MKILLIDVNCKNSSTGKIVYDLYTNIKENGHQAAVCYGRGEKIEEPNVFKFGLDWETYLHAALARITGLNGYFSFFSTRRLIRYIKKFQPDIIHIHELHAYFVNHKPLLKYIKKQNIRVVWTFHCEYMYTGKCGHAYECENWKTECGNCPAVKEYPKSMFLDATKRMFRDKKKWLKDLDMTIVTPSKWLADRVRKSFLKDKEITVIHNGIDTNIFKPTASLELRENLGVPSEDKIVLFVAPDLLDENKGASWVLEIAKRMLNDNVSFVLVGQNELETDLDNVYFAGKISNQKELAKVYSMADVLLVCSKRETFPTVCLEAQCCGTPIVGFDAGGTKETLLTSEQNVVSYGDIDSLYEKIIKMLAIDKNKQNISQMAEKVYSKERMIANYLNVYSQIK